jgi:AcrR family transcriptional regulator
MDDKKPIKNRIIDAAWELFHEKGYGVTTVDDIINRSGTSKGSFYYYFTSKDELLDTLAVMFDDKYNILIKQMDPNMNSFDKLLHLNYETALFMEKTIDVEQLAFLYSTQLVTKGNCSLLDQNRYYYKVLSDLVEEGQKRDQIKSDKSVRDIVHYYSMCERSLIYDWCLYSGDYSLSEFSKENMAFLMEHFRQ